MPPYGHFGQFARNSPYPQMTPPEAFDGIDQSAELFGDPASETPDDRAAREGVKGWTVNFNPTPSNDTKRIVDGAFTLGGNLAIQPTAQAPFSVIYSRTTVRRGGGATMVRDTVVPPWGIAFPITAGGFTVDCRAVINAAAPVEPDGSSPTIVPLSAALGRGWTITEHYNDQTLKVSFGLTPTPLPVPQWARTVTLVLMNVSPAGAFLTVDGIAFPPSPVGSTFTIPAGNLVNIGTFDKPTGAEFVGFHTLNTDAVGHSISLGLIWEIVSP